MKIYKKFVAEFEGKDLKISAGKPGELLGSRDCQGVRRTHVLLQQGPLQKH